MNKYTKKVFFVLLCLIFIQAASLGFGFKKNKQVQQQKPKMPETKQEWLIEAQSIPLVDRKLEVVTPPKSDKKNYYPEPKYIFEKYNLPHGTREFNIQTIIKNLNAYPIIVADINCHYVAYSQFYYAPDINQISSNFFVAKLDTSKTKTKRILEYNHAQQLRVPIIEAGTKDLYPNLFQGLTLVDWSADSKKLLIKEKVGSMVNGVYKTNLYVHFMGDESNNGYTIKLTDFDETLKNYFLDAKNLQIVKYKYEVVPLGFNVKNDDVILVYLYFYDKENNRLFMGTWGYNVVSGEVILYSSTSPSFPVSLNGLVLKRVLD